VDLALRNDFACSSDQQDQNIECPAAYFDRLSRPLQQALSWKQLERSERKDLVLRALGIVVTLPMSEPVPVHFLLLSLPCGSQPT
jgi:hypothetical protein